MRNRSVKKNINLLEGRSIEKVIALEHIVSIAFSDNSMLIIEITPPGQVDMFLSEKEGEPITNDDLIFSTF